MPAVAHGVTTARTSIGTTTISGLPFAPVAIVFYAALRTATGWGASSGFTLNLLGTAESSGGRNCSSLWVRDNVATSENSGTATTLNCIEILDAATPAGVAGQANVSVWGTDGFTLNWTNAASAAWRIYYMAIGGAGILDAATGIIGISAAAGVQAFGGVGFRPDFLMVMGGATTGTFGMASGADAANQTCLYFVDISGENPTSSAYTWSPGNIVGGYRTTGAGHPFTISQDFLASLTSFDADGFTITKSDPPAAGRNRQYLAIRGGHHEVGVTQVPAATGVQDIQVGGVPISAFFLAPFRTAASVSPDVTFAFGATDGLSHGTTFIGDEDGVSPSVTDQYADDIALLAGGDFTTPSADSAAAFHAFANNSLQLNWTAVSGAGEDYAYWVMTSEEAPRGGGNRWWWWRGY